MSDPRDNAINEIRAELSELDLDWAESAPGLFSVRLPGTRKLVTECALEVGGARVEPPGLCCPQAR